MRKPAILFVNLRLRQYEGYASLLAARRLGYEVALLADHVPEYATELAAGIELVDTYQLDQSLAAARALAQRLPIVGVVTWTERDVELVAHIGQVLNLPAPTLRAARLARNKYEMKQALAHLEGVVPRHAHVQTLHDLHAAIESVGFPGVLKPVGASSSKGIFVIHDPQMAHDAFATLQRIAQPAMDPIFRQYGTAFIYESYLDGPECSVEGWVSHGEVSIVGVTDKLTTDDHHLEYQHIFPSVLPASVIEEIKAKTEMVVRGLGFDACAFHLEGKWTADGFRLIEVAARTGGDYIVSGLVPMATGIDFYAETIRVAVGLRPQLTPQHDLFAGVRFLLSEAEGQFEGLKGLESVISMAPVQRLELEQSPGSMILLPPRHFTSRRVAAVLACHPSRAVVQRTLDAASERCEVLVDHAAMPLKGRG